MKTELTTPRAPSRLPPVRNGDGNGHRNGNGKGNDPTLLDDPRAIATEIGMAMLGATSIDTVHHCDDVVVISEAICDQLGVSGSEREDTLAAARLHDVGKASIPKEILEKDGPLGDSEWQLMRQHTLIGEQILSTIPGMTGVAKTVRYSHERWDGDGYPDGLAGEEIPAASRIIFCADAFHAIRSDRPYRQGRSAREALAEVRRGAGSQFDPHVFSAFEEVVRELRLVPKAARAQRPSRLLALLLVLGVGATGSAIARSGLFFGGSDEAEASVAAPPPAVLCDGAPCTSLLDVTIADLIAKNAPAVPLGSGLTAKVRRPAAFAPGSLGNAEAGEPPVRPAAASGAAAGGDPGSGADETSTPDGDSSHSHPHGSPPGHQRDTDGHPLVSQKPASPPGLGGAGPPANGHADPSATPGGPPPGHGSDGKAK